MHLYRNIRIHQLFGANTDVGKTIFGTALALSSAKRGKCVRYLKPVSTGAIEDADDQFVKRYCFQYKSSISQECFFQFKEPVSPHLALRLHRSSKEDFLLSDELVNSKISAYIDECAAKHIDGTDIYVETAGGVHSPSLGGVSQVDGYRPLRLPVVLVGDPRLGGISSTISSYESLVLRGYAVDVVLIFKEQYYRNWEYLTAYFTERGVHVEGFPAPPAKNDDFQTNFTETDRYFSKLLEGSDLMNLNERLDENHKRRIDELHSMPERTLRAIWWPFVQHKHVKRPEDVTVIDSAFGDFFSVYSGHSYGRANLLRQSFDGSASWWTQAFGHARTSLAIAAARAAGRYGHVMFPQATHRPALELAERLLSPSGPGAEWASRVFYSDDGSTAMEIALKMALRAYCLRHGLGLEQSEKQQLGVLGLKGSYHGDTIGAMDACYAGDGVYTCEWHSAKGFWLDPPSISMRNGSATIHLPDALAKKAQTAANYVDVDSLPWVYDVSQRLKTKLAETYRQFISETLRGLQASKNPTRLAALVIEPLVLGAGGMIFVDPLFQRVLVDVVRDMEPARDDGSWRGLPVIFDEVFVGLYRLGLRSCIPTLGVFPDIAAYAKILTGGLLPLSVTLASNSIFEAFISDSKADALLHGHSYSAHAVGCEVANESLILIEKLASSGAWDEVQRSWQKETSSTSSLPMWSIWSPSFLRDASSLAAVESAMAMGTVLAFKLRGEGEGYRSQLAQARLQTIKSPEDGARFGVHFRTLGDVAYFMTSLDTHRNLVEVLEKRIIEALTTE